MKTWFVLLLFSIRCFAAAPTRAEIKSWQQQARRLTITRDNWGIAHVSGQTDADAVFGALYAQAEDDFPRIETNYLNSLGRLAEAEGESKIFQDLRMRLFIDPTELQKQYAASPPWLRSLMDAFAAGLNYFLYTHPQVKPLVLTRFEPWMALSFTEGSIGGDIERIDLADLQSFYDPAHRETAAHLALPVEAEPSGSNGIAIAPSDSASRHALLLINPHTSFFFRSELQMTSREGLNAYGAVTWGQFFIYQGFNEHCGWMHTSSGVDAVDEYLETVSKKNDRYYYRYGANQLPVSASLVTITYRTPQGLAHKTFTVYRTQHGPVIRKSGTKWVSISLMQEHIKALIQSYSRTKSTNYLSYRQTMELHANSSNNTIFADSEGNIAYFHANFIPRRATRFDWTKPVDGSDTATSWHDLLSVDETPHLLNPHVGWLYNSNNWPWSAAGPDSPRKEDFPAYVESGTESARGRHALRLLENKNGFTLDSLTAAAYDSYLPWFDRTLPALLDAWDKRPSSNATSQLAGPIAVLRDWDHRWAVASVPTSLAVFWGEALRKQFSARANDAHGPSEDYILEHASAADLLSALQTAVARLTADFGTWQTPWGQINRFQRLNGSLVQPFNDARPSIAVGFTSSVWGSLASFGARPYPGTKKWYGTSGNSFVAVVEFGTEVRAKAITAGGESGHPESPHFDDEAARYAKGELRDVYFYPADIKAHAERHYRPGQ